MVSGMSFDSLGGETEKARSPWDFNLEVIYQTQEAVFHQNIYIADETLSRVFDIIIFSIERKTKEKTVK